tara:strand:+ start:17 stop:196 length:180 start_codon:yes stop_codon:yes gene_type:complete
MKEVILMGKGSFMTKIVITAAGKGTRSLPFSMEMTLLSKNLSKIKILKDNVTTVISKKN